MPCDISREGRAEGPFRGGHSEGDYPRGPCDGAALRGAVSMVLLEVSDPREPRQRGRADGEFLRKRIRWGTDPKGPRRGVVFPEESDPSGAIERG